MYTSNYVIPQKMFWSFLTLQEHCSLWQYTKFWYLFQMDKTKTVPHVSLACCWTSLWMLYPRHFDGMCFCYLPQLESIYLHSSACVIMVNIRLYYNDCCCGRLFRVSFFSIKDKKLTIHVLVYAVCTWLRFDLKDWYCTRLALCSISHFGAI